MGTPTRQQDDQFPEDLLNKYDLLNVLRPDHRIEPKVLPDEDGNVRPTGDLEDPGAVQAVEPVDSAGLDGVLTAEPSKEEFDLAGRLDLPDAPGGSSPLPYGVELREVQDPARVRAAGRRRARRRALRLIGLGLVVALAFVVSAAASGYRRFMALSVFDDSTPVSTVLVIGTDVSYTRDGRRVDGATRADTLMLVGLNRETNAVWVMSIPRDTLLKIPGHGTGRVNAAHAYGGHELVAEAVSNFLGIPVHRYVATDFAGFTKMVDLLGGIEVNVEKPMKYSDRAGGLDVDLEPGLQVLDGQKALEYVRYRNDRLGDIGRAQRQQEFVKALAKKAMRWDTVLHYREIVDIVESCVTSDMTIGEMASFGYRVFKIGPESVKTVTLPGRFYGPYWKPDAEEAKKVLLDLNGGEW